MGGPYHGPAEGCSPACAGTPEALSTHGRWREVQPRVRGDATFLIFGAAQSKGAAPRARGRPQDRRRAVGVLGCSPACAGTPQGASLLHRGMRVQPRVRGDAPKTRHDLAYEVGAAPRARGRPAAPAQDPLPLGCSPACAGTPTRVSCRSGMSWVQPRVRGDAGLRVLRVLLLKGAAPRARGRRRGSLSPLVCRGCSPACAGTPERGSVRRDEAWVQPRVRGDAIEVSEALSSAVGAAPRARGRPQVQVDQISEWGCSPACAGTPASRSRRASRDGVQPRVRGDALAKGSRSRA